MKDAPAIRGSLKRKLLWAGLILLVPVGLYLALLIDHIPMSAALPPGNLKTIEDFRNWKRGAIQGRGSFENDGVTYTVMLAPAGRFLASGPSAYLFDAKGQFIDWTGDMGDLTTVEHRFKLMGGEVKNIVRENPGESCAAGGK